jgi:hypothetical protein
MDKICSDLKVFTLIASGTTDYFQSNFLIKENIIRRYYQILRVMFIEVFLIIAVAFVQVLSLARMLHGGSIV